jgi:hypothetical protein
MRIAVGESKRGRERFRNGTSVIQVLDIHVPAANTIAFLLRRPCGCDEEFVVSRTMDAITRRSGWTYEPTSLLSCGVCGATIPSGYSTRTEKRA